MLEPDHFTAPTTGCWQALERDVAAAERAPPFRFGYPARLPDGRWLRLPIRRRVQADRAVASFIANHASLEVLDALAAMMADQVRAAAPDVVVGLPTLGLALAAPLARALGHARFLPLGTSRKYWYEDRLSVPASSITTAAQRRLYVDPNLVPLLAGRRVLLVDDTVSSGTTALAALKLLGLVGAEPAGFAVAMSQGRAWHGLLAAHGAAELVTYLFATPHFARDREGWTPVEAD